MAESGGQLGTCCLYTEWLSELSWTRVVIVFGAYLQRQTFSKVNTSYVFEM